MKNILKKLLRPIRSFLTNNSDIYDREGLEGVARYKEPDPLDIFQTIGPGTRGKPKSPLLMHTIYVPLEDFYFGKVQRFKIAKSIVCPACNGLNHQSEVICGTCEGKRTIQSTTMMQFSMNPGTSDNTQAFLAGKGNHLPSLEPGDIAVIIKQLDHPQFKRQGNKLILDVSAPLAKFTNGFELIFQHIGLHTIVCKSDPNIALKEGDLFRIKNEGMPNQQPGGKGDLYLRFHDNSDDGPIYGNTIALVSAMPCEVQGIKHVTCEQVDEIPPNEAEAQGCAQQ